MVETTDLTGVARSILPNIQIYGSALLSMIAWFVLIALFIGIAGVIIWKYYDRKKFNNIIILFEKINGRWVDTFKDKAMEMPFGDLGMTILYAKKKKRAVPRPNLQSGIRKFYFRIRSDGNWENFELQDDENLGQVKFHAVEKAITERNVGIRKGLADRLVKKNWIRENMTVIMTFFFFIVLIVGLYLIMEKVVTAVSINGNTMETALKVQQGQEAILQKLDTLMAKAGVGSGFVPT